MDLVIEHRPGDVRVILQGPADSAELQRILSLLQNHSDKLWCLDEERNTVALSAGQVLWAETVDDKLFVYTEHSLYQAPGSLAALGLRWERFGFFRCGKSTAINLNTVQSLRSRPGGRIEALLKTGEKIIIFRRYSPALREKLQGG